MKRLLLILLLVPLLVGCTIELDDGKDDITDNTNNEQEEEIKNVGISSSLSSPLGIDKYGLSSKYNAKTGEYVTVDAKINQVLDNSYIEKYNKEHEEEKFTTPKGYKSYVIEYEVILTNFETENFGIDPTLDIEVLDEKGKEFVYNKIKQIIEVKVLSKDLGIVKNGTGKVIIAFNIPDNYNSFIIKLGTKGQKVAYFKI